ncbi:MAG: dipeptidase [Actinomycetota bacterium]|nr:dipeptidase [Actinomycetota bacterium]
MRARAPLGLIAVGVATLFNLLPTAVLASSRPGMGDPALAGWTGVARAWGEGERSLFPEDRYAMAGGCYAIQGANGRYVVREDEGFSATAKRVGRAEPFHFQATDLGRYLLFGSARDFVAGSEGLVGEAAYASTESHPGEIAGGVTYEETDEAADELARSEANDETGRGDSVVSADNPSRLADWKIRRGPGSTFLIRLPETDQALVVDKEGRLDLVAERKGTPFAFELTDGCAVFPEIEVNVKGPLVGGRTRYQEVRGFLDAHLHMMAFEFLGGRARCGRPWHRFGVARALVDCPDHKPGGYGAVLESLLSKSDPTKGHDTDGWPTFEGWPRYNSLTHEQVYYKWLERAWRGGLRMFTNLLVDNNQLCKVYPFKKNSCNEMDGVRLQAKRIHQLQDYIDAQSGGPGEGWFRIVKTPYEAREVINEGKLAVVLGIEVSVPLDCGLTLDMPRCDTSDIDERLDEVYDLGVRQMELVNKFDNALSGVAGDEGTTGVVVNHGNKLETGHYWRMDTCEDEHTHAHDRTQMNWHDQSGSPDEFTGRDSLAGAILAQAGVSGATPVYPEGPHCNILGLSELGEKMIREMAERGMIFDPDHMSAKAQAQALDLVESLGYSGIISSHGWSNETIYPRIYELGGVVTPYAGNSSSFVEAWRQHRTWEDDRYFFGFGYGADTNGFGSQGAPRGAGASNPVEYPFEGLGGVTVGQQRSGTRVYDVNTDGVAHYGLYPDWIEDLRRQAGDQIVEDMTRGPEAYLQMWERAVGVPPDSCREDVEDLTRARLRSLARGMTPEDVLRSIGQPAERRGRTFGYCVTRERTATVRFTESGELASWTIR